MLRVMISAGEPSGDLHGAALIEAAAGISPALEFFGLGGDRMAAAGARLTYHLKDTAVMGLTEVFGSLGGILRVMAALKEAMEVEKPVALVLIDLPDFNLRLAKAAHRLGIPVIYYICPQVWAWRKNRLWKMARYVDRRLVIFPFEAEFYRRHGLEAEFVGHPLLDRLNELPPKAEGKKALGFDPERPLLLLMPGSRQAEISRLTPIMLQAADILLNDRPGLELALALADSLKAASLQPYLETGPARVTERLKITPGASHRLLNAADAVILASGTATLEAALCGAPMVVTYKLSPLTWFMARRLVKVPHVAMANLIAGREIVPELLQNDATPEKLAAKAAPLLSDTPERRRMTADLEEVKTKLGRPGASERVARIVYETALQYKKNKQKQADF